LIDYSQILARFLPAFFTFFVIESFYLIDIVPVSEFYGFPFPAFCVCSPNRGNLTSCFPLFYILRITAYKGTQKKSHNQIFVRLFFIFLLIFFIRGHELITLIIKSIISVMRSVMNEQNGKIFRRV